ncbi:MAG TPA: PSD1 and planctomycete cytochrome C domain-containing protein [Planctomycetaceae bacterium]|nr:PSD1 and planctomycete cytochrome C domain-containing protein [Planctomycetaceae bacterium]
MKPPFAALAFGMSSLLIGLQPVTVSGQQSISFNRDIRPILAENCFYCHGQDSNKRQANLRLDIRDVAVDAGALVPGDATGSAAIQRINSDNPDEVMPPPKSNRRLSAEQKHLLERWISEGANFQTHWAFEAPVRPVEPIVKTANWVRNPIDTFVLRKLEAEDLRPSPEADRATLIRRVSIDLVGLPPTPEEVDAFITDESPQAYESLVDRLMAGPHYGERMALSWLDAARYADSNGFQQDGDTWQWIWRDWVVKALNEDLPFDKFTIWQLAGDLLPDATNEQKIASAFNRNHLLNGEGGAIAEEQRWVNLFDRMETTSTTWLGLTMNCAQCHDHKYDPMTQRDYYSMLDAFNRVPETGTPQYFSSRIRVGAPFLELPTDENKKWIADFNLQIAAADVDIAASYNSEFSAWRTGLVSTGDAAALAGISESFSALLKKPEAGRSDEDKQTIDAEFRKYFDEKIKPTLKDKIPVINQREDLTKQLAAYKADQIPRVMIMSDDKPRETSILSRGEYLNPTEKVSFATPAFLPPLPDNASKNRLGFAQWLMAPDHPLTARVQVNRFWQHYFGTGIIKTSEDLGVQSEYPTHGDLLDWLAVEFRESGWSMKHLHRLIVTSATYRQSSRVTPELLARDSENRLFARASRFRMPAMLLRDWALAASGLLNDKISGAPVYPYQPGDIWEALAITKERDFTYPPSFGPDLYRRSLYTFWRRTVSPANMFDTANRQTCRVRQTPTSTPLHALTTLNDPTWIEAARVLAEHAMQTHAEIDQQLEFSARRVLSRQISAAELNRLTRAFEKQLAIFGTDEDAAKQFLSTGEAPRDESLALTHHAALTVVCLTILNLDEAMTRE